MLKEQKGITLIALVITIIVLLILAGVTIAMLSGQDGILTRATDASLENSTAEAKEMIALEVNDALAKYYDEVYVKQNIPTAAVGTTQAEAAIVGIKAAFNKAPLTDAVWTTKTAPTATTTDGKTTAVSDGVITYTKGNQTTSVTIKVATDGTVSFS